MILHIRATERVVQLDRPDGGSMPARVWQGHSDKGVPVLVFVTRVAAQTGHDLDDFERDLQAVEPPNPDAAGWPARMLID